MSHVVYFVQSDYDGLIKIGQSRHFEERLAQLRREKPSLRVVATVPGTAWVERMLHLTFWHCRVSGEWFYPAQDLMAAIKLVADCEDAGSVIRRLYPQYTSAVSREKQQPCLACGHPVGEVIDRELAAGNSPRGVIHTLRSQGYGEDVRLTVAVLHRHKRHVKRGGEASGSYNDAITASGGQ